MRVEKSEFFEKMFAELEQDPETHLFGLKYQFSELVCQKMQEQSLTRPELANKCNLTTAKILQMFRDERNLTMEEMSNIAFALGCKIEISFKEIEKRARQ